MPTTYTDQFYVIDPALSGFHGSFQTVQQFSFVDSDDDGYIRGVGADSFDGLDITQVWVGDTLTMDFGDGSPAVTITGVTFYLADGRAVFTPTDGSVLQDGTVVTSTWVTQASQIEVGAFGPPCFVSGTLIDTPGGPRPVEALGAGDLVLTADHGAQPVRWAGARVVAGRGRFAPVRFAPGVLGNAAALLVSPQHRMVLDDWRSQVLFGEDGVLAAAAHLVDGRSVRFAPCAVVRYHHLMFDRHEIVFSGGVASESFHPGDYLLDGDAPLRAELVALFPDLATRAGRRGWCSARRVLRRHEAAVWRAGAGAPERRSRAA